MVQSTYALRDSSKLNTIDYTFSTTDNDDDNYPYKKKKLSTTTLYSSDFYTSNDPQYYQHQVTILKPMKRKMSSRKTKSGKQRGVTGTRRKKGSSSSKTSSSSSSPPNKSTGGTYAYNTQGITTTRIQTPGINDVLCGRGGNVNSHSGNVKFRSIVAERKQEYNLTQIKTEKSVICQEVIQCVHCLEPKGRFLQKPEGCNWWVECDNAKALAKTSQALREGAPKIRALKNTAAGTSSKRGRKSSLGKRKRHDRYERKNSYESGDGPEKDIHDKEIEDAKHPLIVPMPNGHRGKQLVPRPDGGGDNDDDVVGEDDNVPTTSDTTTKNVEDKTTEAYQNRIKRLKMLMKPRAPASALPTTPSSQPPLPPLPTSSPPKEGQPSQCSLSTEHRHKLRPVDGTVANLSSNSSAPSTYHPEDLKNLIPSPTNGVLARPSNSFFRAHSMAFSEENHDSSFRPDESFVNPFQNDFGPDVLETNKSIGTCAATTIPSADIVNSSNSTNLKMEPSPTSTAITPSRVDAPSSSSVASTPIANVGLSYSPLNSTSNHNAPPRKESSFPSSPSKPETNVYYIEPQNRSFTAMVDKGNVSNSSKW